MVQARRWSTIARSTTTFIVSVLFAVESLYPALYHGFRAKVYRPLRARLLLVDILIDTLLCVLIPCWLVAPFAVQYLIHPHVVNSNYSETWYAEGVLTFKQSLATTPLDLITKLSPFYLNYMSLVEISTGAHMQRIMTTGTITQAPSCTSEVSNQRISSLRVHSDPVVAQPTTVSSANLKWYRTLKIRLKRIWIVFMRLAFASFSLIFIALTVASSGVIGRAPMICRENCLYTTIPWFTKTCICIVQELNCVKLNISGSDGVRIELEGYAKDEFMAVLIVNDCRGLVIPRSIRNLPNLMELYVYSSELIEWGEGAALTSDAFAFISYVVFVNTILAAIPVGLLTNLASTVQDIEIIGSSRGTEAAALAFPANLHDKWPDVGIMYVERCNLTSLPEPLLRMQNLKQLSLAGNAITDLPKSFFTSPLFNSLGYLILSANRELKHLPLHMEMAASPLELYVDAIDVDELNLTTLPASSELEMSAAENPVCASGATATISSRVFFRGLYDGMYTLGIYPLLPEQRATRCTKFLPHV